MINISFITPAYNAESYISDMINSIISQSIESWELIIIDDCSCDNTKTICMNFAKIDTRIKYRTNKSNLGAAESRNLGIKTALGKYLAFVDADDTIQKDFAEKLLETANRTNADIIWCNYSEIHPNGNIIKQNHNLGQELTRTQSIETFYNSTIGIGSMCNKLYRSDFVHENSLKLNEYKIHGEDWDFNLRAFQIANKVVTINDNLYNYIRREGSTIAIYRTNDIFSSIISWNTLLKIAPDFNIDITQTNFWGNVMYNIIYDISRAITYEPNLSTKLKKLLSENIIQEAFSIGDTRYLTKVQHILYLLISKRYIHTAVLLFRAKTFVRNLLTI